MVHNHRHAVSMIRQVVASGIILAALLVLNTAPALAGYGAVAYDEETRKLGFASNEDTQKRADEVATRECGGSDGCKVRFRAPPKQCAAFAAPDKGTAWGGAVKATLDAAKLGALENCQKQTKDQCTILESSCNK
jgi:hypothetical protein